MQFPISLSKCDLDLLLQALDTLEHRAKRGILPEPGMGICYHWQKLLRGLPDGFALAIRRRPDNNDSFIPTAPLIYVLVAWLGADWKYSAAPGDRNFASPVPCYTSKWTGEGLELRLDLIRYMRKRLRDWRRRTPA